jgi:protein-L-isoaspartate(D-aspartate) O-methyltransferase
MNPYEKAHKALLSEIDAEVRDTAYMTGRTELSAGTKDALRKVPRHEFVPDEEKDLAYANRPLPVGNGQTISQPYIVAIMTDLLDLKPTDTVLEAGTGSGYQAAVLSLIAAQVFSLEVIPELGMSASERLQRLGYANVEVRIDDAHHGWPEHAPYDAIIVTAAAPETPPALLDQLKPGGRMIIPLGTGHGQLLVLVNKGEDGRVRQREVLPVAFVPFTRRAPAI